MKFRVDPDGTFSAVLFTENPLFDGMDNVPVSVVAPEFPMVRILSDEDPAVTTPNASVAGRTMTGAVEVSTVNFELELYMTPLTVTDIVTGPVMPAGTGAIICVSLQLVGVAVVVPNVIVLVPCVLPKPAPVTVTGFPTRPEDGVKEVIPAAEAKLTYARTWYK